MMGKIIERRALKQPLNFAMLIYTRHLFIDSINIRSKCFTARNIATSVIAHTQLLYI